MTRAREAPSMTGEPTLRERYDAVRGRVADAAERVGRRADDVILTVVTKHASIDQVRELLEFGHVDFGENRVQALIQRAAQIEEFIQRHKLLHSAGSSVRLPVEPRWHMIGHLQRNKVRRVVSLVRLIHSVDSLRLAEEIQIAAARLPEPVEVLVQVNASEVKIKGGVVLAAAQHLLDQIDTMMNIRPRGLMCMAPLTDDPETSRPVFERCQELFEEIQTAGSGGEKFDILSMGMSSDFEVAIECGANVVRVGTAVFGAPIIDTTDHGGAATAPG